MKINNDGTVEILLTANGKEAIEENEFLTKKQIPLVAVNIEKENIFGDKYKTFGEFYYIELEIV